MGRTLFIGIDKGADSNVVRILMTPAKMSVDSRFPTTFLERKDYRVWEPEYGEIHRRKFTEVRHHNHKRTVALRPTNLFERSSRC